MEYDMGSKASLVECKSEKMILIPNVKDAFPQNDMYHATMESVGYLFIN